jgi:hypothetical protein
VSIFLRLRKACQGKPVESRTGWQGAWFQGAIGVALSTLQSWKTQLMASSFRRAMQPPDVSAPSSWITTAVVMSLVSFGIHLLANALGGYGYFLDELYVRK